MRDIILKRKSWHRWLANCGTVLPEWQDEVDICRYTRLVISGIINVVLFAAICAGVVVVAVIAVVASVLSGLYYLIFSPITELMGAGGWKGVSVSMTLLVLAMALIGGLVAGIRRLSFTVRRHEEQPAGFIRTALRSWKDKVCFTVKFTEE